MELLRFDHLDINPGQASYQSTIFTASGNITDAIIALQHVECWGYGVSGTGGGGGFLRKATLDVNGTPANIRLPGWSTSATLGPPKVFFTSITNGQQMAQGDSGGPCYSVPDYRLVGIMRDVDISSGANPSPAGVVASVGGYKSLTGDLDKQLQRIADRESLQIAQFGDVDGDNFPDLAMLSTENGFIHAEVQFTGVPDFFPIVQDGLVDLGDIGFPSLPQGVIDTALASIGDFDGNGAGDILMFIGGTPVYYDGKPGAVPALHVDSSNGCLQHPLDPKHSAHPGFGSLG